MTKIWKATSRICFDTTYYVKAEECPDVDNIINLAKDGYVPEFNQTPEGPEYALGIAEEVSENEYKEAWVYEATDEEKESFLIDLDNKPPENLVGVGTSIDTVSDPLNE